MLKYAWSVVSVLRETTLSRVKERTGSQRSCYASSSDFSVFTGSTQDIPALVLFSYWHLAAAESGHLSTSSWLLWEVSKMQKEIYWSENKNIFRIIKITGILLIPVLLYLIPLEWLKNQHSVCIYKNITGNECYGCGMTRAVLSAIHFQFMNAFNYNKLFIIVFPLLIYIWAKTLANIGFGTIIPFKQHFYLLKQKLWNHQLSYFSVFL